MVLCGRTPAGIPEEVVYRPKWKIGLELLDRARQNGVPGPRLRLVIARNVLNPNEIKFFLADAPPGTPVGTLLLVGFSRWHVERCFEDQKDELGLDHYEGRCYAGLKRHLILSAVSYLFLSRVREEWGKKIPELTLDQVHDAVAGLIESWWLNGRASPRLLERLAEKIPCVLLALYCREG
jgi:SRSO17 transposase